MTFTDLVVDTNVLAHASNPEADQFSESIEFANEMMTSNVQLCVDEGFDLDESKNRSLIGQEYLKHLVHGQIGSALVILLAQSGRI